MQMKTIYRLVKTFSFLINLAHAWPESRSEGADVDVDVGFIQFQFEAKKNLSISIFLFSPQPSSIPTDKKN